MVRALLAEFPDADPEKLYGAVDTVERFQGSERQTIIVSFGVGDTDVIEGEEAFLLQMERTNVAVSRARGEVHRPDAAIRWPITFLVIRRLRRLL